MRFDLLGQVSDAVHWLLALRARSPAVSLPLEETPAIEVITTSDGTTVSLPLEERPAIEVITASDGTNNYLFSVANHFERFRAESLATKEAGTISWIKSVVREGDVFVDIGANIGLYSLVAARQVGRGGMVYAFEPHAASFLGLLKNIDINGLGALIRPLSCALHFQELILDFNYYDWLSGSSMSQLGSMMDAEENQFVPVASELKLSTTLDRLVETGAIRTPTHVKIDVDGNESYVLRGMERILSSTSRPETVQVEINERHKADLFAFMESRNYEFILRHDTARGKSLIEQGVDPATIAHNAIFRPGLTHRRPAEMADPSATIIG